MPLMLATGAAGSLAAPAHWQVLLPQPVTVEVGAFMAFTSRVKQNCGGCPAARAP
jgi:hypothetical protein